MAKFLIAVQLVSVLFFGQFSFSAVASEQPPKAASLKLGWTERARLFPGNILVEAKLDTGARTSSIDAQQVKLYDKEGVQWVRFNFSASSASEMTIHRPVVRTARIKDLNGPTQRRPVVRLGICMGDRYRVTEFTLFDRTDFNFRLLIGRRYLSDINAVVNSKRRYTTEPACTNVVGP